MEFHSVTADFLNQQELKRLSPLVLYLALIVLAGVPGNALVCYAFRNSYKTSNPHLFFLWLGVLDLVTCSVILPAEAVNVFHQYTYTSGAVCKLTIFSTIWLTLCSGSTLCVISIDRYRKVCCPLAWQLSNKHARVACLITVLVSLLFAWPSLILFGINTFTIQPYNVTGRECSITHEYQITSYPMVYNGTLWIGFVGAISIIGVVYSLIGRRIFRQNEKALHRSQSQLVGMTSTRIVMDESSTSTSPSHTENLPGCHGDRKTSTVSNGAQLRVLAQRQARARRSAFVMFVISLVFVISFLPYLILRLCKATDMTFEDDMSNTERAVYKFVLRLYFLNSAANPFIYCACARKFRKECRYLFRRVSGTCSR